jgi:hypothetical protein
MQQQFRSVEYWAPRGLWHTFLLPVPEWLLVQHCTCAAGVQHPTPVTKPPTRDVNIRCTIRPVNALRLLFFAAAGQHDLGHAGGAAVWAPWH